MFPCEFAFEAIGTIWKISIGQELSPSGRTALLERIMARIDRFDRSFSRFREDSDVTRWSRAAGTYPLPEDAGPLFALYRRLYDATGGACTPLIGQTLSDAGYDAQYSLRPNETIASVPSWDDAVSVGPDTLEVRRPVLLDFGAAGKGYLVDLVADLLREEGVTAFCVDAGGDIRCEGVEPMRIGLEHPSSPDEAIGVATVTNGSVCGSSGSRRAWDRFHHTIDPRTLASPTDVAATWAFADRAALADGLATCLFLVSPDALAELRPFEYVILYSDMRVARSPGAPVELFSV